LVKIIGITTIGTYFSPWFAYTLASIYTACDEIIVANGGFDIKNPKKDVYNVPLEKASGIIKYLDIRNKITELKHFTIDDLDEKHRFKFSSQFDYNEGNLGEEKNWFDCRGVNITYAQETACKHGATHILKIDSDQACYQDVEAIRNFDKEILDSGIIFHQHEFSPDIDHLSDPPPASPFNDSVFIYKAVPDAFYGGGGSPALYAPRWWLVNNVHCAHLRLANPVHIRSEEKFQHIYERVWFERWTNTGLWGKELETMAHKTALSVLKRKGTKSNLPALEVCQYMNPINYIQERLK
jgi:hypothetical protein